MDRLLRLYPYGLAAAFVAIALFAYALANAQETTEVPIICVSKEAAEQVHNSMSAMKGVTLLELRGEEKDRFVAFVLEQNGPMPNDDSIVGIILVQIEASAGVGRPRTAYMLIRNEEPAYCSSRYFIMPPDVAERALAAVFGQKS